MSKLFTIEYYKYFYDKVLTKERTEKEINFLVKYLNLNKKDKILDLACGFWRHTEILLKRWYNVFWIDYSKNFIDYITSKSNFKEKYFLWDLREKLKINNISKAFLLHTSFWYFSDKENEKIVKNISEVLISWWKILIDLNNPNNKNLFISWKSILKKDDDYIIDEKIVNGNTLDFTRIIKKQKEIFSEKYKLKIYSLQELKKLFLKYNLILFKKYWNFNWEKFLKDSKRMILIFEKK